MYQKSSLILLYFAFKYFLMLEEWDWVKDDEKML